MGIIGRSQDGAGLVKNDKTFPKFVTPGLSFSLRKLGLNPILKTYSNASLLKYYINTLVGVGV